jgi:hypothetical protein
MNTSLFPYCCTLFPYCCTPLLIDNRMPSCCGGLDTRRCEFKSLSSQRNFCCSIALSKWYETGLYIFIICQAFVLMNRAIWLAADEAAFSRIAHGSTQFLLTCYESWASNGKKCLKVFQNYSKRRKINLK